MPIPLSESGVLEFKVGLFHKASHDRQDWKVGAVFLFSERSSLSHLGGMSSCSLNQKSHPDLASFSI